MRSSAMTWLVRRRDGMRCAMARGRETMQQPTKRTNKWTNKQRKWVQHEAMMQQGEGMEVADSGTDT